MENVDRLQVFEQELKLIKDEQIKTFATWALCELPDYFFEVPASSTGKYHPQYALGDGGLVRHTKAAVRIASTLFNLEMYDFNPRQKDFMITALLLHDGAKSGIPKGKYTVQDHPQQVCKYLEEQFTNGDLEDHEDNHPSITGRNIIYGLIETHMGQWHEPKPTTPGQQFVHLCDYLASRKLFEVNFDTKF